MALAIVQDTTAGQAGGGATTIVLTLGAGPTQNNLLVSPMFTRSGTATNPTGYTTDVEIVNATEDDRLRITSHIAGASESSTVTWTGFEASGAGNTGSAASLYEVSGAATSSPFDKSASTGRTASASSLSSGTTATLAQAAEICFVAWGIRLDVVSPSVDNGYTLQHDTPNTDVASAANLLDGYRIVAATTAQTSTLSWTFPETAMGAIATYKEAGVTDTLMGQVWM